MRWETGLVFKRLNSLFHYNEIPLKPGTVARARFYRKLLLAGRYETVVNKGCFPTEGRRRVRKEWSFSKEVEVSLVLVSMLVPGALDRGKMMRNLPVLPEVCANSKRKREPVLRRFLGSA
jgi:hypothetical protein